MEPMPKYKPGHYAVYPHYNHGKNGAVILGLHDRCQEGWRRILWLADDSAGRECYYGFSTELYAGTVGTFAKGADPLWVGTEAEWLALRAQSPTPADLLRNIENPKAKMWAPGLVAVFLDYWPTGSPVIRSADDQRIVLYKDDPDGIWEPRDWNRAACGLDAAPDWVGTQAEYDVLRLTSPDANTLRANIERINKAKEPESENDHSEATLAFLTECGFCAQTLDRAREMLAGVSERACEGLRAKKKLDRISDIVDE